MNTRTPNPLDDEERELARILHALPAGEPSAALDAKILRAAQNAVAAAPDRKRWLAWGSGWLSLGGLSTAAAAVLTVGVAWQVVGPAFMPAPQVHIPAVESVSDDALSVDISGVASGTPVIEPVEPLSTDSYESGDVRGAADAAKATASAAVERQSSATVEQALPPPAVMADSAHSEIDEHFNEFSAPAAAAPAPPASARATMESKAENELQGNQRSPESKARDDMRLSPRAWIRKIRARIAEGDVATARVSLGYYASRYPEYGVPEDLKDLLEEEPQP